MSLSVSMLSFFLYKKDSFKKNIFFLKLSHFPLIVTLKMSRKMFFWVFDRHTKKKKKNLLTFLVQFKTCICVHQLK